MTTLPFHWQQYISANPDLIRAGILTENKAIKHWTNLGIHENRQTTFSFSGYLDANPDLRQAGQTTDLNAFNHWCLYGLHEGRLSTINNIPPINWQQYIAANPDLIRAGILTEDEAIKHWTHFGIHEKRLTTFSFSRYLDANPDLRQAGQTTDLNAFNHWCRYGLHEGRNINSLMNTNTVKKDFHKYDNINVIFVAHTMDIVLQLNRQYVNPHILFVGSKTTYSTENTNIIIVRDLPNNIEHEGRLLTFTAWYAVVHNNLYSDSSHLCILEYDVQVVSDTFCDNLKQCVDAGTDIIGFSYDNTNFLSDITESVLTDYLNMKGIDPTPMCSNPTFCWLCSTNLCVTTDFLKKFVQWYDYEFIKSRDSGGLPFYHERLVAAFTTANAFNKHCMDDNVVRTMLGSHSSGRKTTLVLYNDGTHQSNLNNLIESVVAVSPTINISIIRKSEMSKQFCTDNKKILDEPKGGGYWLWKPYVIVQMMESVNDGDVIIYSDSNKYRFIKPIEELIDEPLTKRDIVVWSTKPGGDLYYQKQLCKKSVIEKYFQATEKKGVLDNNYNESLYNPYTLEQAWAGLIVVRKNPNTMHIMREWLQMCCVYEDITDAYTGQNQEEFLDHRHDQSLLTIVLDKFNVHMDMLNSSVIVFDGGR